MAKRTALKPSTMKVKDVETDKRFQLKYVTPTENEKKALRDDIERRGILVPLLVTADGLLLDGHRRLSAAKELEIEKVPVCILPGDSEELDWWKSTTRAVNLWRRHLNEAARALLATSLLKYEEKRAQERKREAGRKAGKIGGRGRPKQGGGNDAPHPKRDERKHEEGRAKTRIAAGAGISRKTMDRVDRVQKKAPKLVKPMVDGKLSVAGAAKKLEVQEIQKQVQAERPTAKGLIKDLSEVAGRYRVIYADPPWKYQDSGTRGTAQQHYPTVSVEKLQSLPVGKLAHKEGCWLWLWTTWPKIRDKVPHAVLDSWGFRWVGELVWNKCSIGTGRYLRGQTEVLILAVKGKPKLMASDQAGYLEAKRGKHSEKPKETQTTIERLCLPPYIELFARSATKGWDRWGLEA
jgi:N6-adenosine-specific RNA methylase IME4